MLFLHIGLHKTATTSLQHDVFPSICGLQYLGRSPGGIHKHSNVYQDLIKAVCSSELDSCQLKNVKSMLQCACGESDIVISEEWLTSGYDWFHKFSGCNWRERIKRLAVLTEHIEVRVLCTIRLPSKGLVSQYQELCSVGLADIYPTIDEYITESVDSQAWDCDLLSQTLNEAFSDVVFITFDDLLVDASRNAALTAFFGLPVIGHMRHLNNRELKAGKVLVRDVAAVQLAHRVLPSAVKSAVGSVLQTRVGKVVRGFFLKRPVKMRSGSTDVSETAVLELTRMNNTYHKFLSTLASRIDAK